MQAPKPILSGLLFTGLCLNSSAQVVYPVSKTVKQSDVYHGVTVEDPYRWLEDDNSAETKEWVTQQNAVTEAYLTAVPYRQKLKERLTELWNFDKMTKKNKKGKLFFSFRNDGLQNQAVLYVGDKPESEGRVLLDPNSLSTDGTIALKGTAFSADGKYMAYGLSSGGSDWEEWRVLNVAKGEPTEDVLKWVKFSAVDWNRDGKGFWYSRYDEPQGENALKAKNAAGG